MPEQAKRIALEATINVCVEQLRAKGHEVTAIVDRAVIDRDADQDGRLDANPDTGAGIEPGDLVVTVWRADAAGVKAPFAEFRESYFARFTDAASMTAAVEKDLARQELDAQVAAALELGSDDVLRVISAGGILVTEVEGLEVREKLVYDADGKLVGKFTGTLPPPAPDPAPPPPPEPNGAASADADTQRLTIPEGGVPATEGA